MSKPLIVYYSRKGENYWNGQIKNLAKGNTEIVAEQIADLTGGDLFEVQTVQEYPADYYACTDQAKSELQQNARPTLRQYPEHLEQYDTDLCRLPQLVGHHADGDVHPVGGDRPERQAHPAVLHQRGQRHGPQRIRPAQALPGRNG